VPKAILPPFSEHISNAAAAGIKVIMRERKVQDNSARETTRYTSTTRSMADASYTRQREVRQKETRALAYLSIEALTLAASDG